jgi:hypothetical protein
LAPI